ncbi:hypothetical protein ACYZT7_03990 [Pseudomonas sp. RT4P38]
MNAGVGFKTFICAGAVILVADELPESDRHDGLDALLYSQTVASHKVPDFSEIEPWTHANKMAMRVTGAMLLGNPNVSLPVPMPGSFTLVGLMQQIPRQWMPVATANALDTSLKLLSGQASAALASEVLQQHVLHNGRWIRFTFGFITQGLAITTVVIAFEFDEVIVGNLLCHRFNTEKILGNVSVDGYKALLDPEDYDLSRAKVVSLLGARRQEQIIALI